MIGCSRWHLSVTAVKILKSIAAAVAEYQRKSPLEDPGAHARVKYGRGDDYYEHVTRRMKIHKRRVPMRNKSMKKIRGRR